MIIRNKLLGLVILGAFIMVACGGVAAPGYEEKLQKDVVTEEQPVEPTANPTHEVMSEVNPEDVVIDDTGALTENTTSVGSTMVETPDWFDVALTDARTGKTFTVNDFKGKVVLIETMAIWCSNCLRQQGEVKTLHEMLGHGDDLVSIGLDIDPNENSAALKSYVESKGFDWLYAVPPVDVSREIAALYGDQFLNPPSTPILVIDRRGEAHPLPFGLKSADDLMQAIQPYLDA